jgi:hypothetical protein
MNAVTLKIKIKSLRTAPLQNEPQYVASKMNEYDDDDDMNNDINKQ